MNKLIALFLAGALTASAQVGGVPPATPVILEPEQDGQLVSGADVHMVTAPFSDPDGHRHRCTDWEIVFAGEVVWEARCATDASKIHIHMADGAFAGIYRDRRELPGGQSYTLRARHRDDSGNPAAEWSLWGERTFVTTVPPPSRPLAVRDVLASPPPQWTVVPPRGTVLRLEAVDGEVLLEIDRAGVQDGTELTGRSALKLVVTAGEETLSLPETELAFEDENGTARTIYVPAISIAARDSAAFWVSANGGTHRAEAAGRAPDFEHIARGAPVPWKAAQRGFVVERFATGFQLPVNLAFVTNPGDDPGSPLFYVVELYGNVQVVTRSGEVRLFAENLLDVPPSGDFPGDGEAGLVGLAYEPESGDLFATAVYWPDLAVSRVAPRVLRLRASEDGLREVSRETIAAFPTETQSPSHQISNITIGPDGLLYVHVGDAAEHETAQDLKTIRGKILRMNLDGTPAVENPLYLPSDGISAADYVFALGLRNPFGGAWRAADQSLYCVENGPATDRFSRIVRGRNYGWDGNDRSMRNYALHRWWPSVAPVQIAFVQPETFDGSGFPRAKYGAGFITESGVTWATGVQDRGKRITEVVPAAETLVRPAVTLVEYDGTGKATVAGIAAGPDGLYFTDLYKDFDYASPIDRGANVFRVRWKGFADFRVRIRELDGLTLGFDEDSDAEGATAWTWDFGDGQSSSERHPLHRYAAPGVYRVRLTVTSSRGTLTRTKKIDVGAPAVALRGEYFSDPDFRTRAFDREDPELDFDWLTDGPAAALANSFSVLWSGSIRPRFSETYRFTLRSTDRARVRIGGVVVIDQWESPDEADRTAEVELEAGREVPILVEYRHDGGNAALRLSWESESQVRQAVPRTFAPPRRRSSRP